MAINADKSVEMRGTYSIHDLVGSKLVIYGPSSLEIFTFLKVYDQLVTQV